MNIKRLSVVYIMMSIFLVSSFFSFMLIPGIARAQESISGSSGVSISPPLAEITTDRGKTLNQRLRISNPSSSVVDLYPVAMDFTSESDGGQPKFISPESDNAKYSLARWIQVTQSHIAVAPQQIMDYEYTIVVPADAEPGGHYGVIFLSTEPPQTSGASSQVSVSSMIGSLIMLKVNGDTKEIAQLLDFWFPRIIFSPSITIETKIANTGNLHLKPIGEIDDTALLTSRKTADTFNPNRGNILPDGSRKFENKLKYNLFKDIGPHKIELKITYGGNNTSIGATKTVWFFPWWLVIVILMSIAAIVMIVLGKRRKHHKNFKKYFKVPGK